MKKRRNKLSEMTIKSVDVCGRGANQEADIVLTKSMDEDGERMNIYEKITKTFSGLVSEATGRKFETYAKAMQESEDSIMNDASMEDQEKIEMLDKSIDQFFEAIQKAVDEDDPDDQEKPDDEDKNNGKSEGDKEKGEKKMDFDVEKMSTEDRAVYEEMKKKYGGEVEKSVEEIHPEVKKAMDEVAELRKSLEMRDLEEVAKAYEICGKNPKELAGKLYDLKKAGGSAYEDYIGLLNEMKTTAESGIFKEFGSNRSRASHANLNEAVAEVKKQFPELSEAEAVVKAYELNPDMAETM